MVMHRAVIIFLCYIVVVLLIGYFTLYAGLHIHACVASFGLCYRAKLLINTF